MLLKATAALVLPVAAMLAVLTAAGTLSPAAALGVLLAVAAATALLVRAHLADLAALAQWVRSLAQQGVAGPPPRAPLTGELVSAIGHLRRHWQAQADHRAAVAGWQDSLFDSLPDPLILLAEGRRVVRLNRAARAALGRDLTGHDLAVSLRTPAVMEAVEAVLAGAEGRETEFSLRAPVERRFVARVERLLGAAPEGSRVILVLHDVTQVRRIEQMRADFVANSSHELRTPLAALLGFIDTLRGPARDDVEAQERFLGIMHDQASRMARLVNDLLSLSRIELNEHSQPSARVDLARIAAATIEALQPLAAGKAMALNLRVEPGAGTVVGQDDELTQLVQNLLDNAVKYGRDGTPVEVVLAPATRLPPAAAHLPVGRTAALAVTDHGEGIAREHLPRLTERFYRVDTARSRKMGGTGLGLAIVKHIVNRHRGALVIESTPGRGSTFTVYLPVAENSIAAAVAAGIPTI